MSSSVLGDVALVSNGKTPPVSEQRESGFPVLKIRDVDALGNFRGPFGSFVDGPFAEKFSAKHLHQGDTLILNAAHNADYVASKTFYAKSSLGGPLVTGEWTIVRPNPARADTGYVRHFIESTTAKQQLKEMVNGIHLYPKDVARLALPLPPLPEQRRIAAILDKADALRAKRREAIAKLDQLLQSVFLDMFGDPVTNPKGWPRTAVDDLCTLVRGSSPRPQGDPRYFGGPVPRLMVADLTRDGWFVTPRIDSLTVEGATKSRPTKAGTVVMAVSGNVGLAAILAIDACIHDGFVGFSGLDESMLLPRVLLMNLHFIKQTHHNITAGAIFQNLTTTDIKRIELPIPPVALQKKFIEAFESMLEARARLNKSADLIDHFWGSTQTFAFAGQLSQAV